MNCTILCTLNGRHCNLKAENQYLAEKVAEAIAEFHNTEVQVWTGSELLKSFDSAKMRRAKHLARKQASSK